MLWGMKSCLGDGHAEGYPGDWRGHPRGTETEGWGVPVPQGEGRRRAAAGAVRGADRPMPGAVRCADRPMPGAVRGADRPIISAVRGADHSLP